MKQEYIRRGIICVALTIVLFPYLNAIFSDNHRMTCTQVPTTDNLITLVCQ